MLQFLSYKGETVHRQTDRNKLITITLSYRRALTNEENLAAISMQVELDQMMIGFILGLIKTTVWI